MRLIPVLLLTVSTGGALAQATGGSSAPLPPSPGELRGPGLPVVPNNRLAPLPNPVVTDPGVAPVQGSTTAPAESAATPGVSIPPAAPASVTPGVVIELPPPAALAPTQPGEARACPSGITFC